RAFQGRSEERLDAKALLQLIAEFFEQFAPMRSHIDDAGLRSHMMQRLAHAPVLEEAIEGFHGVLRRKRKAEVSGSASAIAKLNGGGNFSWWLFAPVVAGLRACWIETMWNTA